MHCVRSAEEYLKRPFFVDAGPEAETYEQWRSRMTFQYWYSEPSPFRITVAT